MKNKVSKETKVQAMKMTKGTQNKALSKEQTKLISQGIEKGIAEYKKQQAKKARSLDKQRKQKVAVKAQANVQPVDKEQTANNNRQWLPWLLLLLSWTGFIVYYLIS